MNATKLLWSTGTAVALVLAAAASSTPALAQTKKSDSKTDTGSDSKSDKTDTPADTKKPSDTAAASGVEPPHDEWDIKNVEEVAGKTYLFLGLRYRGVLLPKFVLNMFVDEGKSVYTNQIGLELDIRKEGFSLIPALTYAELGTGDILFKEKGTKEIAGNYNLVNSSLKVIYATADLLWSTKISKNLEFEYGAGFGLGVVFGDLVTNWVKYDNSPNAPLRNEAGQGFTKCTVVEPAGTGCNKADHQNSDKDKVNNYVEPSWFGGGSTPSLFPWIAVPQVGLRFKPIKQFVGRLGLGFSLTGFWFGLSGEYGLEQPPKP
jgi:hypothetical protein